MEQNGVLNVAIVGGGPGCKAIMDMIFAEKLSQLDMKLIGVASTNPEAVGYLFAKKKGIYTTSNYRDLYGLKDLNMIIELTGREEVAKEISATKPGHVRLMDHAAARLFWDVIQIEQKRSPERKRSEEATNVAYAELNQILETSANGIRVIDKDFKVLRVNEAFLALSGVSKDDAIGKKCYDVFHGPLCHTPGCPLSRVLGGEERVERDAEKQHADGTKVWCIVAATAFRGPDGELIGIVEDFKDITKRKRAEEERERLVKELQEALAEVKTLSGLLPICSSCKKIRDDKGYWNQIEAYIRNHSEAEFSHSICPECAKELYPDLNIYDENG